MKQKKKKISSKNSRTTPNGKQKGRERAAACAEQNDKTVTAEDLRKKMKDEGDDSAEALNTSQESMEKSMKKRERRETRRRVPKKALLGTRNRSIPIISP